MLIPIPLLWAVATILLLAATLALVRRHRKRTTITLILHLEDQEDQRVVVATNLNRRGRFHIEAAVTLEDAIRLLSANHYDAVLADLGLPDSNGADTVRRLREASPYIPIVVLTGSEDSDMAAACMRAGANGYLRKQDVTFAGVLQSLIGAIEDRCAAARLEGQVSKALALRAEAAAEALRERAVRLRALAAGAGTSADA